MDGTSVIEPGAPPAAIDSRGRLEHRHDVAACFKFPDLNVKSNRILFEARSWRLEFVHVKTVARCDNCVHKIERDGRWCRRGVWKTDEQLSEPAKDPQIHRGKGCQGGEDQSLK